MRPATAAAEASPASGRTIGEILLARSLVTDEALDEAMAIQRETGKPLGQILVEAGTITRLELASALAEQWGDAGTISPTFPGGSAYIDPTATDGSPTAQLEELRHTRRALEERMLAFERTAADAQWQQEIATGVRALFSRVDVLEATVGQVSDRDDSTFLGELREAVVELARRVETVTPELESVRERVDGTASVAAVQHGLSELAGRIDDVRLDVERAEGRAEVVAGRVEEVTSSLAAAIDDLRRALQASAVAHGELAARLDGTASVATIESLQAAVAELAQRPSADPALSARVEALATEVAGRADDTAVAALSAVVAELERRPSGDPALAGQLDELAARIEELGERIELGAGVPAGEGDPDPRVDALITRVAELAARPSADPALEARLAETAHRVEAVAAELAARPSADPALEARLAETAHRVEAVAAELAARPSADPALEARLEETAHRVDAVAAELAGRADAAGQAELSRLVAELAERPSGDPHVVVRIDELAARLEEVAARPVADPAVVARIDELAARVEQGAAESDAGAVPDPRVDGLLGTVDELASRVAELAQQSPADPGTDLDERLAAAGEASRSVAQRLSQAVSAWAEGHRGLEARIEWLAARVEAAVAAPPVVVTADASPGAGGGVVDADVERLRMAVERLMLDFAEQRRALSAAVPGRDLDERVRKLSDQVDELTGFVAVSGGTGNGASPTAGAGGSIDRELAGQVKMLVGRVEEVEASSSAGRETMLARLERMMGTIDWRLQRLENPGS